MSILRFILGFFASALALAAAGPFPPARLQATANPQQEEFFEKKIRPVLAEKCYLCHSASSKPPMGGLRVDARDTLLKGGDRGPVIVPGDPEKSLLIQAISYRHLDLKMPPNGKLAGRSDRRLCRVDQDGRPGPSYRGARVERCGTQGHRCGGGTAILVLQTDSKSAPATRSTGGWPISPVDRFILAKLEEQG